MSTNNLGVDEILARARQGIHRLTPLETQAVGQRGALVIDTRTDAQRALAGDLPGAIVIDRTVLEWRLDPQSPDRIPEATDYDIEIVVVCRQGYSSSLAAASLRSLGLHRATDMIGGMQSWLEHSLPTSADPADIRV